MAKITQLEEALSVAINIIESYQADIRERKDLMDEGFCQGTVYSEAISDIKKIAGRETETPSECSNYFFKNKDPIRFF